MAIGVLALQGDYEQHERQARTLGAKTSLVKLPEHLNGLDGLIMPGGESTTMNILLDRFSLRRPLKEFGRSHPIYGTCAGMILLAKGIVDNQSGVEPLALLDIDVIRNGYGRQLYSFEETVEAKFDSRSSFRAAFIRAPKVDRLGKGVDTLAIYRNDPVLVRQGNILAASFHNELGDDTSVLGYFLGNFFV
ncbi:MAG: pyridoxal 5'-phosphate synthase glutaminase subunit PdxT [Candidatus Zixiibacteriota bacterium]